MKLSRSIERNARKTAVAFALSALAFSVSAGADEQKIPYTMTAITDASFGSHVTAGDYETAIQRISAPTFNRQASFESKTNLCVAYTKSARIEEATAVCEAAVSRLRRMSSVEMSRTDLAIALSNRGVLRAVKGETDLARKDFQEAIDLRSGLAAPETNLARLDSEIFAETYSAN